MTIPVLEAKGLFRTYGARKALNDVSITVQPGEMVALIGPSGSGKSTLLRNATGLITTDEGTGSVKLLGIDVQKDGKLADSVRQARARVGFVFQQFNLVGRLSLFQNVMLGALGRLPFLQGFLGQWPEADQNRAMQALARVGVADYAAQRANTLSGGQQQRGAIARALVQGAEAIFLDEPVASLDPVSARKVMELLRDLNQRDNVTVIVTLHQIDYATKFCDRIVALKAGQIVYDGPKDGLTRDRLIEIYGAEFDEETGDAAPKEEPVPEAAGRSGQTIWEKALQWALVLAMVVGGGFALWQQAKPRETADVIFSILATENSQNLGERWKPLLADMEKQTGLKIKPYFQTGYAPLVTAMQFGQTQVGWFSNKPGWEVVSTGKAEVFLRSSDPSGIDGYNSVVIVNKNSPLTIEDLLTCDRSRDFGMGDASSTSGTLAPMTYLFAPRNINPSNCFKTVRSANHEANVRSVAAGLLEAATNNSTSLQVLGAQDPELIKKVKVIWTSPTLPEDPIIWRKDLDPVKKQKIRAFFLNYGRQGDKAQQDRERAILASLSFGLFQPANNDHLLPVRQMQATEDLMKAQQTGDVGKIDAAKKAFDAIQLEAEQAKARAVPPLPSTPTEGYAIEGKAVKK
ncbi:phosphate-import ATP-binding protein PhnC [Candidatus Phycosocius bacilliformis]|uniref:Phosphate-import ATP-binding protein PhnC n=2 Tax=Candidatus Phycosocius bacilliformis TaxID=1445552 RepID=A0A2P2E9N5_9PROT|nr:phosphate-import ATP-binding protein PhnC [Candidatus Phycosocius bacilliformis]